MKSLFLILLSFILLSFDGSNHKNDLEKRGLKGKVKVDTEIEYSVKGKGGDIQKDSIWSKAIIKYAEKGNQTESLYYLGDTVKLAGNIAKNIYNSENKLIESDFYDGQENQTGKVVTELDGKSNIVGYKWFDNTGRITRYDSLKCDSRGNVIEENSYAREAVNYEVQAPAHGRTTTKYDNNNMVVEYTDYGISPNRTTFKHDKNGNSVEINRFSLKDSLISRTTFKYYNNDKEGNWLKSIAFENGKAIRIGERVIEYYP